MWFLASRTKTLKMLKTRRSKSVGWGLGVRKAKWPRASVEAVSTTFVSNSLPERESTFTRVSSTSQPTAGRPSGSLTVPA